MFKKLKAQDKYFKDKYKSEKKLTQSQQAIFTSIMILCAFVSYILATLI